MINKAVTFSDITNIIELMSRGESADTYTAKTFFEKEQKPQNAKEMESFLIESKAQYEYYDQVFKHLGFLCQSYYTLTKICEQYDVVEEKKEDVDAFFKLISNDIKSYKINDLENTDNLLELVSIYKHIDMTFYIEVKDSDAPTTVDQYNPIVALDMLFGYGEAYTEDCTGHYTRDYTPKSWDELIEENTWLKFIASKKKLKKGN